MEQTPPWDDLRVLLAVHQHQSFLRAGRALGLSTSTTARRIAALEAALGRVLVHRSRTGARLEPEALPLLAVAEQFSLQLSAALRDGRQARRALAGTVRLSVGDGFAGPIAQIVAAFRRKHPETLIELVSEARFADLAEREADLGIRTAPSGSRVLIERPLGTLRYALFASPDYVARRLGAPVLRQEDFARHDFIGYTGALQRLPLERWLLAQGAVRFPFRSNTEEIRREAVLQGQGICPLAELVGGALPGLVRLSAEAPPPVRPLLVHHQALRRVPRVRALAQEIEASFRARLGESPREKSA